ncbi:MAG: pitrilysin family protein [Nannocystaceae bacterium]
MRLIRRRLPNGARVLCLPTDDDAPVAIQLWVAAGTAAEREREHGCAHLLEHLLFKPFAKGGPPGDLALLIESLGGDVNAFTSHDETVLYATVPADGWGEALDGILWSGLRPRLDSGELEREIEVVVEEIKQYDDDPGARAVQSLLERVHGEHPYARPVLGLAREVRSHSARRLRAFHRRVYAGERLTLVVVGPVDPKAVIARARPILGAAGEGTRDATRPAATPATAVQATVRRADVLECHLLLGWRAPGLEHPDVAALDVATIVLGHGDASRLIRDVRRRAKAVTDVHASLDVGREASTVMISARTGPSQVVAAHQAILAELQRMAATPISAEELARARAALESDLIYRRETVQGQAHALGYYASQTGEPEREEGYYRALAALTPEDVQQAVARWMPTAAAALSVLLPEDRVDAAAARGIRTAMLAAGRRTAKRYATRTRAGIVAVDLDVGLRLRIHRNPGVPVAGAWLAWLGGMRREPAENAGLASLTAATLTRGNGSRDGDSLSREIEGMAAGLSGFTGRNTLGLHGEAIARHFPLVLRHLLECALTPSFPEDEIAEERRVALEELAAVDDDLGQVAIRELRKLLYRDHPYARPLRGTRKGLRSLDQALLRERWRKDYPIGQAVLAIAGDVDVDAVVRAIDAQVSEGGRRGRRWRRTGDAPTVPTRPRRKVVHRDREQAHIAIGYPGICLGDPRSATMEVLCAVLGGQSGRLFLALREEEGLVYHVDASSTEGLDAGHMTIYAATSQEKLGRALAAIERHLAAIVAEPVSTVDLERAKVWLIGQHDIALQRRGRVANEMAIDILCGLEPDHFRGYRERVAKITAGDLLEFARSILDPRRQSSVLLTREGVAIPR